MSGGLQWCSWCCKCRKRDSFCCTCCLCKCCCRCPPPVLPGLGSIPKLPCMPSMGPPPPPFRVVREQVIVPVPFPVYTPCMPRSNNNNSCFPFSGGSGGDSSCSPPPPSLPPACCYEPDPECLLYYPCPPAFPKRIFKPGKPILPGYMGHIPGLAMHGAGRTHGAATKDTCCIISQWGSCCPRYPKRIFEQ